VIGPENSRGTVTQNIGEAHGIDIRDRRRAVNDDWIAPAVATLIEPDGDAAGLNVDQISRTIAVHVTGEHALGLDARSGVRQRVGEREVGSPGDAASPAAATEIGPIVDRTFADQNDVL